MKKILALLLILITSICAYGYSDDEIINRVYNRDSNSLSANLNLSNPVNITTEDGDRAVAITNAEYFIKEGNMWSLEVAIPVIEGNTTYYLTFDTRDMTKTVNAFPIQWEVSSSYVIISQGIATDFTGGTDLSSNVKNRKAGADDREVEIFWNPSITGGSFPTLPNMCAGGESTNQTARGGLFQNSLPMILGHGTLHCFKIENPTVNDIAYMNIHIDWIEIEPTP